MNEKKGDDKGKSDQRREGKGENYEKYKKWIKREENERKKDKNEGEKEKWEEKG